MKETPLYARIALCLNLVGTILLALSFQATSSDFRMVTASDVYVKDNAPGVFVHYVNVHAICSLNDTIIMEGTPYPKSNGKNIVLSTQQPCPDRSHSVAIVNTEHPRFLFIGLILSAVGFFMQFLAVPRRKTIPEINGELRALRKEKKLLELQDEQQERRGHQHRSN